MKSYGVGVIGYGFMGRTHTYADKTVPFYYDPPPERTRLVAVCEASEQIASAAAQHGGFERWTTDELKLIADEQVDIVHVCTPNQFHFAALAAAMAANKHIYVDKPVTASLDQAQRIADMLGAYKGTGQVALQFRFYPATLKARQLVEEGFLGQVTHFRAAYLHAGNVDPNRAVNWKSTGAAGGGVIRDLGSHLIDLLWWLTGPFDSACSTSRIWSARRPSLDKPGTMIDIDVEDAAVTLLKRPDGAFGAIEYSKLATGSEDELRFEIHGRHGAIRWNSMDSNYLEVYDGRLSQGDYGGQAGWQRIACIHRYPAPGGKFPGPKFPTGWLRGHVHSLYCFLKCLADGTPASPSLAEGIHLQKVLEAVRESADKQAWVKLPEN